LWKLFENSEIYKFLTGEKDTVPEFCYNWVGFEPRPQIHFNAQALIQALTLTLQVNQPADPFMQRAHSAPSPSSSHNLRKCKLKINSPGSRNSTSLTRLKMILGAMVNLQKGNLTKGQLAIHKMTKRPWLMFLAS
jgi:hypothetical protein